MTTKKIFDERDLKKRVGSLTVGKVLRAWRLSEDMSLKDFGKLVGLSVQNLSDIEHERTRVSPGKAAQIAKVLEVPETLLVRLAVQENLHSLGLAYTVVLEPSQARVC